MLGVMVFVAAQAASIPVYLRTTPPSGISANSKGAPSCSEGMPASVLASLRSAVSKYYKRKAVSVTTDTPPQMTTYVGNLNASVNSALVFLEGKDFCGSGGCELLVIKNLGPNAQVISDIGPARLPVVVLKSQHHGWHDIGVTVAGGGITTGYMARLSFDGSKYPDNPTVAPAVRIPMPTGTSARALLSLPGSACRLG